MPEPIEAIKVRMEQQGLTPKDLEPAIGRRNHDYEILIGKRNLTLAMVWNLHPMFGIPAESLIKPLAMPDIRLRIELLDTDPLVWRRVLVPEQINLHRLHEVIQAVMGWEDCHLFEFECNGRYYGEPDDWSDRPIALARNAKLKTIAARLTDNTFHYLYDFGDDWLHRIVVEATGLAETNPCPRLVDGAMACPPEDIGGISGFEALKEAAAGRGDEHGEMLLDAMGGDFDPQKLDTDEIDFMLEPIQAGFRRGGRSAHAAGDRRQAGYGGLAPRGEPSLHRATEAGAAGREGQKPQQVMVAHRPRPFFYERIPVLRIPGRGPALERG